MTYLLDTNTCIRYLNGQSASIRTRLERSTPEEISLCSVVKAELLYGTAKNQAAECTFAHLRRFFELFRSLPFDDRSATAYGEIRADLERRGVSIGANDLMIAAIPAAAG